MINLLQLGTVTSSYGDRTAPTAGASTDHKGIDIVLKNDDVPAVKAGTVIASGHNSLSGNYVKIKDSDGRVHSYFHLNERSSLRSGDSVAEGQTIGQQGQTGIATGVHLHYEVKDADGSYINPADYLGGSTTQLAGSSGESDSKIVSAIKKVLSPVLTVIILLIVFVGAAFFLMKALDVELPTKGNLLKKGAEILGN